MSLYTPSLIERARELRRNMTKQEAALWKFLRSHKFKFYRQRPIGSYIVDFYCRKLRLVIEVDGEHHNSPEAMEYDTIRTEYMNSLGLAVIRFSNDDIDTNFSHVCAEIDKIANGYTSLK